MRLDSLVIFCVRPMLGLALIVGGFGQATVAADEPNPIFAELLQTGVDTGKGVMVKLPKPTMADRLDAAEQLKAIKTITDPNRPLMRMMERSDVAPFQVKITAAPNNPAAFHVDLSYIAYGSLETVANKNFLKGLGNNDNPPKANQPPNNQKLPNKSAEISPEDLVKRGIMPQSSEALEEKYGYSLFELMDKVYLSITTRSVQTRSHESITLAGYVDPRFEKDTEYPNQWQPIGQNNVGLPVLGKAQPYSGAGGYLKVTQLKEPADALFIEAHLVYNEPHGWFGGLGLLRSKIPILAKDNVTEFRKKLKAAQKDKGQAGK